MDEETARDAVRTRAEDGLTRPCYPYNVWREMILGGLEKPWPHGWVLGRELIEVYQLLLGTDPRKPRKG